MIMEVCPYSPGMIQLFMSVQQVRVFARIPYREDQKCPSVGNPVYG